MNGLSVVTAIDSPEALNWGLKVEKIATPMVLLCSPDMARALNDRGPASHVRIVPADLPHTMSLGDKLVRLGDVCRAGHHDAHSYYWLDVRLIYQHLSFEFLYGDLLARAIERFAPGPACFPMPGYAAGSFFGGPRAAIEALAGTQGDALQDLFDPIAGRSSGPVFTAAFGGEKSVDLNLLLAAIIDEPVLHVAGDSHVLNCFTPNTSIGCRPNVLVRTSDVSRTRVPYAYQFTHHLGSRTMHFAGQPGALLTVAKHCGFKASDAVVWVFGEIDARSHILRQQRQRGRALDEVIDTLARDYVAGILEVQHAYGGLRSVVFAPIPPLDNPDYSSDDFPVYGSIEQRIGVTRQLRAMLATLCDRHGLLFLDVSAHYESARGDLRWELSDHFCHIGSASQAPVVDGLYELLARAPAAGSEPGISRRSSA